MKKEESSDESDISFASHIELGDLGNSQLISTQNLVTTIRNNEIMVSVNNRHRLLNNVFNEWRKVTKQSKSDKLNKMTFQRYFSKKKLLNYFNLWKDRYILFQNLNFLGQKILMTKHFQFWNIIVNQKFEERKRFMRFLLKRRAIYEKVFFNKWKRSMSLAKQYYFVGKQSDLKLCCLVLSAFRIQTKKKRQKQNLELAVHEVHMRFTKITCMFKWKQKLRLNRLKRLFQKRYIYQTKRIFFEKWLLQKMIQDKTSRKAKTLQKVCQKYIKRYFFSKWQIKFISKVEIEDKIGSINNIIRRHSFEIYFMKWLSHFNTNNYLSSSEKALRSLLKDILIRRFFFKWHSKYDIIRRKYLVIETCEEEMRLRRLSRLFMQLRSQFAIHNFEKVMNRKAHRKLDLFKKRLFWESWKISLRKLMKNRSLNDCAYNFRCLSLKLKAFNRIKIYHKNKQLKQHQLLIAESHYVFHLETSAMIAWKLLHRQTKRRFLMISSVLKVWAHNLQKKSLQKWLKYAKLKIKKRNDILEAIEIRKRRNVSCAITSFVIATKCFDLNHVESEYNMDSSEDLLKSSLSFNNSVDLKVLDKSLDDENAVYNDNNGKYGIKKNIFLPDLRHHQDYDQNKIYFGHKKLPPPKRPDFLGKKVDIYPMQHMISMINAPLDINKTQSQLKNQIEDTISKIQLCKENEEEDNEEKLKQLNSQLKSLMDQANQLLSQIP